MIASPTSALHNLAMRSGRRRMVDALLAAGPRGLLLKDLAAAYYGDGPQPRAGMESMACQVQRLRSQVAPLGYTLASKRAHGPRPGVLVLALADAPTAEPAPRPIPRPTPAEALGIRATTRSIGGVRVSLSRCTFLDGAAP